MDYWLLSEHSKQAERHVEESAALLTRQRAIVAKLEAGSAALATRLHVVAQLEELQRLYIADRDRLAAEVDSSG
jgi:hypothetical protein